MPEKENTLGAPLDNKGASPVSDTSKEEVPHIVEPIPYEDYKEICFELENYHSVFATLTRYGRFLFDNKYPTAWVEFNKEGDLMRFCFNPDYWNASTPIQRLFIVSHECYHIMLNHGVRLQSMKAMGIGPNGEPINIGNIATDVAINEGLVNYFNFERAEIDPENKLCFIDTVFKDPKYKGKAKENECSEFYYNLLIEGATKMNVSLADDHSEMGQPLDEETQKQLKEILENNLSKEEKEDFLKKLEKNQKELTKAKEEKKKATEHQPGTMAGNFEKIVERARYKPKKKWENIIRIWVKKRLGGTKVEDSWLFENKKMNFLHKNVMVPGERNDEVYLEKGKLNIELYIDVSGSCCGLEQRFFNLANSIPRHRFNVDAYSFDTSIYKVDLKKNKLYGGGGTCFQCISKNVYRNKELYPSLVVVMTDGYGTTPNIPEDQRHKWYWLLTEGGSKNCIPEGCKIFDLEKFE